MLIGQQGKKYGLQNRTAKQPKVAQSKQGGKQLAAFASDSDDDEYNVGKHIERQARQKATDKKVAEVHAAALAEDPSIFDYDGVYDNLQQQREQPKLEAKHERKSRYIGALLEKAKEREQEQNIRYERQLAHEREAEDQLFGDKDRFVTAAYRRKLEEDKLWVAQQKRREAREADEDVVKRGHMGDFYRNLLSNNEAFGTKRSTAKAPAATSGHQSPDSSERGAPATLHSVDNTVDAVPIPSSEWLGPEAIPSSEEPGLEPIPSSAAPRSHPVPNSTAPGPQLDPSYPATGPAVSSSVAPGPEGSPSCVAPKPQPKPITAGGEDGSREAGVVMDKEEKAAAARLRYLARKRKVLDG